MTGGPSVDRRTLLAGASAIALVGPARTAGAVIARPRIRRVEPVPSRFVRLRSSAFRDAFEANRRYLLDLEPERLLHNFYLSAGLPAPAPVYGGWEAQAIAGHTLGHWLSACSLVVANTGDEAVAARLDRALSEMARIQKAHGDGYLGGTTVERDDRTVDGKIVFEEVRRGEIRSQGFDLNGGWVPLYTWHKVHAGLLDAHILAGNQRAMPIMLGIATYLAGVLEPLDDEQMQRVLAAEHGGLNESYAETYALTGDPRWLRMAERIRHKAVLDPLTMRRDVLPGLHANTQIPKLIGLARLHEITGDPGQATAASFFHETVTRHHSYVIGGNSEREHFGQPDQLSTRLTEATCEACNSYNMLKLTRHLYSWEPRADWFDFYERVQLNHILAHQRPDTGRFVYFMPLAAGARRVYSEAEDSFWCCVGSGMESHAKHADSIWWSDGSTLFLNLFVPNDLDQGRGGFAATLDTDLPHGGRSSLALHRAPRGRRSIAIRIPSWAKGTSMRLNGSPVIATMRDGYAVLDRIWSEGDRVDVDMGMELESVPTPDDASIVAFTHGPLVLAADLGPASGPAPGVGPALVLRGGPTTALGPTGSPGTFEARDALGGTLTFRPFAAQYDRRTAVYFPTFDPAGWAAAKEGYVRAQTEAKDLATRTVDALFLGEMQPERDHAFVASRSEVVNWNGRAARHVRSGDAIVMSLARRPGAAVLRLVLWGRDDGGTIAVAVDGTSQPARRRSGPARDGFAALDFPLPNAGAQGRPTARIEISAKGGDALVYEVRMMTAPDGTPVTPVT